MSTPSPYDLPAPPPPAAPQPLAQITALIGSIQTQLSIGHPLSLTILTRTTSPPTPITLTFPGATPSHSRRFSVYLLLLSTIHNLLAAGTNQTKRDIFYRHVDLFRTQTVVDRAVDDIAATLGVRRGELGVVAGAKGLVCGPLALTLRGGEMGRRVLCTAATLIPPGTEVQELRLEDGANWVLYIEKEAIFQRLLHSPLSHSGVLVTGKGYADIATRELLARLSSRGLRVYALVDLDPHGLEIMTTVRDGSISLAHEGAALTVPAIRWLGVRWEDVGAGEGWARLTGRDRKKAVDMLRRGVGGEVGRCLQRLLFVGAKAEIEILGEGLGDWVKGRIDEEEGK